MYASLKSIVAGATVIAWALAAANAQGQLFGRRVVPTQQPPAQAAPTQPVPGQVNGQPAAQPNPPQVAAAAANDATAGQAGSQAGGETRFIHGRSLIGMNIWNSNRQNLGTVRDFIVDYQGDCPTIFFAVAPQIAGWNGDYLIVPFNAFQVGFDAQRRTEYFTMNMSAEELGKAPRLAVNSWSTGQDLRPFANARQYYQRVEHSAARPETGGREDRPALPNDPQRAGERTQQRQQPNPQEQQPQQRLQQPQQQEPQQQQRLQSPQERPQPQEQPPAAGQHSEKQPEKRKSESGEQPKNGHEPDADRPSK